MKEKNREQNQQPSPSSQNKPEKAAQQQNTSGRQDPNPQKGNQWNNYQTRELSSQESGEGNTPAPRNE